MLAGSGSIPHSDLTGSVVTYANQSKKTVGYIVILCQYCHSWYTLAASGVFRVGIMPYPLARQHKYLYICGFLRFQILESGQICRFR